MKLVRSSLRAKLTVCFAAVALAFLVAVGIGFTKISSVATDVQNGYTKAVLANEASARAFNMRVSQAQDAIEHKFILNPDGSVMRDGDIAQYQATVKQLRGLSVTDADHKALTQIDKLFAQWQTADAHGIALWKAGKDAASTKWEDGEANTRGDDLSNALFSYSEVAQKEAQDDKASQVSSAQILMGIFSLLALLAAGLIVFFLTRSISRRLGGLAERLTSLAQNCLVSLGNGLKAVRDGDLTRS
ncbi:MAG: hypothetical protein ACRDLK_07505, partial [Gaiellaceae bacterium]